MYHILCRFIILFRLLSVIVTFYSGMKRVNTPRGQNLELDNIKAVVHAATTVFKGLV
jgi:hypothetical protein